MSYFTRHRRSSPFIVSIALLGLSAAGCSGGSKTVSPTAPIEESSEEIEESSDGALLAATDFGEFIADDPDVPLVNVHVPYDGHIEGTDAFVSFDSILDWDGLPADRSAPIALYCRSGSMSAEASDDLANAGYTNVIDLDGGMNSWTADGRELLDDPTAAKS